MVNVLQPITFFPTLPQGSPFAGKQGGGSHNAEAMMGFKPGQSGNLAGRPRGARNKLASRVLEDLIASWQKHGPVALEIAFREKPVEYVKAVLSMLPRELVFENTVTDLSDSQIDELLVRIRDQMLAAREQI